MNLNSLIKENYDAFVHLCKRHKVNKIYAFGSSINESFDPTKSDIDLVVELDIKDPIEYGEMLISLWDKLEEFFNRKVDLLTDDSIKNPYLKKSIESTKKLIYDGQGAKVFV
jgi:predicted nucleotidyltransferase